MKKIIIASITLALGIIAMIGGKVAPTTLDANGMLSEPYFFLTPIGAMFIIIGIALLIMAIISNKRRA